MQIVCAAWQYVETSHKPVECYWWQVDASAPVAHIIYVGQPLDPEHAPNVYLVVAGTLDLLPADQGESPRDRVARSLEAHDIRPDAEGQMWVHIGKWTPRSPELPYYAFTHGGALIRSWVRKMFFISK